MATPTAARCHASVVITGDIYGPGTPRMYHARQRQTRGRTERLEERGQWRSDTSLEGFQDHGAVVYLW
ncbi:MAG TPA: hypothetical protein VJ301_17155, partial [Propionibacteriaceae bacterium]|nr:hypothetical protein [Propionibacteriaceae bacterium]